MTQSPASLFISCSPEQAHRGGLGYLLRLPGGLEWALHQKTQNGAGEE